MTMSWAQSTATGTVSGQVTDQTGATVPGATVTLVDSSTSSSRNSTTNEAGRYIFANVTPGTYSLRITKTGFAQEVVSNLNVEIGQVTSSTVSLKVGTATETVEVTATAVEMQTMNAAIGTTVKFQAMEVLPNLSRDSSTLMTLQPAVNTTGEVAGSVRDQNTFQLDGGNNSSDMDGTQSTYTLSFAANPTTSSSTGGLTTGVLPTPVESIEEFKVATNNQTADFNGSSGGQVQMVTKRGTNAWHGALYEYYLGSNFSANSWNNKFIHAPLPSTHQNRFGAAIGGPALPSFLGGKTYFFADYEGRRFPNVATYERLVPTATLRAGIIEIPTGNTATAYNINNQNTPVTVNGVTYQPAACGGGAAGNCDPRGIGINPLIQQLWSKFEPLPNDLGFGDTFNTGGYKTTVALPRNDNFGVTRIDHDFGQKWHFTTTYHYYRVEAHTTDQVDIGGVMAGDTFGQGFSHSVRPSVASLITAGLTTNVSSNLTNDFHYSYTRNWWQWLTAAAPVQFSNLGGALEIGGESQLNSLIPMNVNTQNARQRFWDGQDNYVRDDVTWIRGNHLLQFGGTYQRNWDYHLRNDNGQGIMNSIVYQIGTTANQGGGISIGALNQPAGLASNQVTTWNKLYAELLGMTSQPQVLYTRSGSNLTLDPLGSFMFDQSTIPSYNVYVGDTWHIRQNLTLSFGTGYTVEMPPVEANGKQVELIDQSGKLVDLQNYLNTKKNMALQGQIFNPILGFETVKNLGMKYPYNPFYGGISPRAAVAWSPSFEGGILGKIFGHNETVIRGGYNRIYGRLNGVDLVLVPLLGTGLGQAVSCIGAVNAGNAIGGNQCLGSGGSTPGTAFRIGVDGNTAPLPTVSQTLAQPYFPGINGNPTAGDGQALDPNFRPSRSDEFDFTIQRQVTRKVTVEAGYIGRILKNEYQSTNLDGVPYMLVQGGQSFANAYDNLYLALTAGAAPTAVPVQPFFEAALGPTSPYCTSAGLGSCTAAVASREKGNANGVNVNVYQFWSDLAANKFGSGFLFPRAMPSTPTAGFGSPGQVSSVYLNGSWGYGNYNAAFATVRTQALHGLTLVSNFTWSKTLGTQAVAQSTSSFTPVDAFNLHNQYGPQPFDIHFIYNTYMVWEPSWYKGQKGIVGHMLGGWKFSPIFTAQSGAPLEVNIDGDCQSFGEVNCSSGSTNENAIMLSPYNGGNSVHYNVPGGNGIGTSTKDNINYFSNPMATYAQFRAPLVGLDTQTGGQGILRQLPTFNLDMSVGKEFRITERVNTKFIATFTNVLNHNQLNNPSLSLTSPQTWGVIFGQANTPRQMEFGIRVGF
jgi:hypothetical protein